MEISFTKEFLMLLAFLSLLFLYLKTFTMTLQRMQKAFLQPCLNERPLLRQPPFFLFCTSKHLQRHYRECRNPSYIRVLTKGLCSASLLVGAPREPAMAAGDGRTRPQTLKDLQQPLHALPRAGGLHVTNPHLHLHHEDLGSAP